MADGKNFHFVTPSELVGKSLKEGVFLFLSELRNIPLSRRDSKALIDAGRVHCNGDKRPRANKALQLGDRVLILLPGHFLQARDDEIDIGFELSAERIVYEDDAIIVVNKISGLNTQASLDPKRDHLFAAVKRYLRGLSSHPDKVYVGLHHRLDVDTSGLVLFTKKKSANKSVTEQFSQRRIEKQYLAICRAPMAREIEKEFVVENYLGRAPGATESRSLRMQSVRAGGDYAKTSFAQLDWQDPIFQLNTLATSTSRFWYAPTPVALTRSGYT